MDRRARIVAIAALAGASCRGREQPQDAPPACALPPRDCTARCDELIQFAPAAGPGYEDVPLDDEVAPADSTSYVRRDLMMVVQYATAKVACAMPSVPTRPLALGDMSDRDGATPGAAKGRPRHPTGSHTRGRDIDLAYYQLGTPDNHLRAICPHLAAGIDQHHCVGAPTRLDAPRTALLIGTLFESTGVQLVGIDAAAAPSIESSLRALCRDGAVSADACARVLLVYEPFDLGRGWFYAHHNHLHVRWRESPASRPACGPCRAASDRGSSRGRARTPTRRRRSRSRRR